MDLTETRRKHEAYVRPFENISCFLHRYVSPPHQCMHQDTLFQSSIWKTRDRERWNRRLKCAIYRSCGTVNGRRWCRSGLFRAVMDYFSIETISNLEKKKKSEMGLYVDPPCSGTSRGVARIYCARGRIIKFAPLFVYLWIKLFSFVIFSIYLAPQQISQFSTRCHIYHLPHPMASPNYALRTRKGQ